MGRILRGLAWTGAFSRGADGVRLALGGGGFLLAAGSMALADFLGAIRASLIVGATLIVVAAGVLWSARRRMTVDATDHRPDKPSPIAMTLAGVGREIGAAASRNPGSFVLAAFLIGLLLSGGRTRR